MGIMKKFFGGKKEEPAPPAQPVPPPASPEPAPEPDMIQVNQILADDLKTRLNNGDDLVVIDMRQAWEYQAGHIPGAIHIFIQEIPMRLNEIPKEKDVVFQCWHGNTSLDASGFLIQNGWDANRVFSLNGGIAGWVQTHGQEALVQG